MDFSETIVIYFFILIQMFILWISNVSAKFDEIPSLPVQDIKEKPKMMQRQNYKGQ